MPPVNQSALLQFSPEPDRSGAMIYGSVCSGVEAATLAWEPLGWKPLFFSESIIPDVRIDCVYCKKQGISTTALNSAAIIEPIMKGTANFSALPRLYTICAAAYRQIKIITG